MKSFLCFCPDVGTLGLLLLDSRLSKDLPIVKSRAQANCRARCLAEKFENKTYSRIGEKVNDCVTPCAVYAQEQRQLYKKQNQQCSCLYQLYRQQGYGKSLKSHIINEGAESKAFWKAIGSAPRLRLLFELKNYKFETVP